MSRLIDADALMDVLGMATECKNCKSYDGFLGCMCDPQFVWACEAITDAPTIDPKRGKWIERWPSAVTNRYQCSVCKRMTRVDECMGKPRYAYCPWCGSQMLEGEEDERTD